MTVLAFIIVGMFVNVGYNTEQQFIGISNWKIDGAPFVGGFGGFAKVFVTASFACAPIFLLPRPSCSLLFSWRDREPWDHCRRDEESLEEHASSR